MTSGQHMLKELLQICPEIQSVALIISWQEPLENIPSSVIASQTGPIQNPVELIRLQQQLLILQRYLNEKQTHLLHLVDAAMAAKAESLKNGETTKRDQINNESN